MGTCIGEQVGKPELATRVHPGGFRRVLGHLPTGVTVITAYSREGPAGMAGLTPSWNMSTTQGIIPLRLPGSSPWNPARARLRWSSSVAVTESSGAGASRTYERGETI